MFAKNISMSRKVFILCNAILILAITLACLIPLVNLLARSLSGSQAILANRVKLWPVDFTTEAYSYVMNNSEFWTAVLVTVKRVVIGVPINMLLTILAAYPLSKSDSIFKKRKYYSAYFIFLMVFNGGLIPTYILISKLGLIDSIWSLVLPGAVPIFNVILIMNFFRGIPEELEESAMLDGASQWTILWRIYIPLSKPSIATVTLFSLIHHWNAWFDGLIYSNFTSNYPLQSYLQTLVVDIQSAILGGDLQTIVDVMNVNDINLKAAQIFISIIPLFVVYPFMQKYFTEGLTLGSVKG
ncbi:carbohydrate ABC transporter permease [Paenibacillus sp. FSL R7-0331]|uniref:carbohydrate ABC transporter permease n=1 Tax=Paenibacillus sp. FSL R7-0331 TaxID=1536773 RepID=UPI0004F88387|nr:carbohydrate ABC transporter permease [Paenibacillus sp. FSL R7-0331]AIQ51395.1 ABC transporter permease [Paenibacillus sp. FSL R7-0331]